MKFLTIFGIGLSLFVILVIGLLNSTTDASTRDGIGFLIVFGIIFYLPILFVIALIIQFVKKDT